MLLFNPLNSTISNPSRQFWEDKDWCNGNTSCRGRRLAPLCNYERKIGWNRSTNYFKTLLDSNPDKVGYDIAGAKNEYNQFPRFFLIPLIFPPRGSPVSCP